MKNKLRALCAFMAAVTLFGAVSCKSNETPAETSASSDTVAETRREETDPVETDPVETDPVETDPVETTPDGGDDGDDLPPDDSSEETTGGDEEVEEPVQRDPVTVQGEIRYEMTQNEQPAGDGITLSLPNGGTAVTGTKVTAYLRLTEQLEDYNYFIVDWGDGTWSYNGPYQSHQQGEAYHTYKQPGSYEVKACGVNLDAGRRKGWTETQTMVVSGEAYSPVDNMITTVYPLGSTESDEAHGFDLIADGDNTTAWRSATAKTADVQEYIGYVFDKTYTLDSLEIKFPEDVEAFPANISVEYTTDGGKTWYMMPHYYYVLPNSEGYYDCWMNFPNPLGATLVLPMENVCANGVRLRSMTYGRKGREFGVEEMRVYGRDETRFYTSYEGTYDADLSNMFLIFGLAKTEPYVREDPFRAGESDMSGSLEWAAWDSIQLVWTGDEQLVRDHVNAMKGAVYGGDGWYYDEATGKYVVDESEYNGNPRNDGFIWATGGAPKHLGEQNHYTNNSSLIIAARDYILMAEPQEVEAFLNSTNGWGQVMLDKLYKAMEYMLFDLGGESGLMTIYDPRNDGTVRGLSSNYWDSLNFFGYNSAYENIFFYEAVLAMADIEAYLGHTAEAEYYASLAEKIKVTFNDYFWDPVKGRYITSVNVKGDELDFGLTMVNFMAVSAGLASDDQATKIYDWVDGRRIIEGDWSTGEDIYNFRVSARTNTIGVEAIEEDGLHYWWYNGHDFNDVLPGHWGQYGQQMQNGGTIFYTSYYDLVGRTQLSADLFQNRFSVIMEEFHKDSLRRDPRTQWGYYLVSINGEFPESGLVPSTFVHSTVGLTPAVEGLQISACLPSDMTYAGVRDYHYNGRVYRIEVNREVSQPTMTEENGTYTVKLPADKTYFITRDNEIVEATGEDTPPSGAVTAPVVAPAEQVVDADQLVDDVALEVDYNNGVGVSLTCNGAPVAKENYVRSITGLTLKMDFVKHLPVGENTFILTTDGGSATFTLTVEREGVLFTDTQRIKKYEGEDVIFSVDPGAGNAYRVTVNGVTLSTDAYLVEESSLSIRKEYLETLDRGAYEIILYGAKETYADCFVVVGMELSEVYAVNFDSLTATGGNVNVNCNAEGRNGKGGSAVFGGSGVLFEIGHANAPFDFVTGQKYAVTLDFKFDYSVDGSSSLQDLLMPIYFPRTTGGNADFLYIRYNATDGYYLQKCGYSTVATWAQGSDGWYRLHFEFVYESGGESWSSTLPLGVWMQTAFTVDNFVLTTAE